jgi:uncharacterized paraquat-inducible protein A
MALDARVHASVWGEKQMATATSRKRFIKCVQCETTLILPGASESNGTRCPVCGYGFTAVDRVVNAPDTDAQRLEEFFARFS